MYITLTFCTTMHINDESQHRFVVSLLVETYMCEIIDNSVLNWTSKYDAGMGSPSATLYVIPVLISVFRMERFVVSILDVAATYSVFYC
ncbi:hypothetical protein KEJ47_05235 [Candidatus Bathyarchaeota archaeon]|nr:hypothetical protein [Candidatus Bathyarchaeota archaeon]